MNRHHPYGGGGPRRGAVDGPGPDRSHRNERGAHFPARGGMGRGRGATAAPGPSYSAPYNDGANGYNQGPVPTSTPGSFSNYNTQPQAYDLGDPYGQGTAAPMYGGATTGVSSDYGQNQGSYEDGYTSGPMKRPAGRPGQEEKVHDSLIEQRIMRERPCRTLFIRNIKYETNSNALRRQFEEHGDVKTFFDLIANRGMVFVTYFDLRAAERARRQLQGSEIEGRPIDVHYSLPRADEVGTALNKDKHQASVLVSLRSSPSGQPIDENEVRRKFQQFGDIKSIKPSENHRMHDQRVVEFYDIRSCDDANERLHHQPLQDGVMEVELAWDIPDVPLPPGNAPSKRVYDEQHGVGGGYDAPRGRGAMRGRGRGAPRGRGGFRENWETFDDPEQPRYPPPPHGHFSGGSPYQRPPDPLPAASPYSAIAPAAPATSATANDPARLEQARQVQQLLAALKQPVGSSTPPNSMPPQIQTADPRLGGLSGYYGSVPPSYANSLPSVMGQPPMNYGTGVQSQQAAPSPAANQAALASLPPNIAALLQAQLAQIRPS